MTFKWNVTKDDELIGSVEINVKGPERQGLVNIEGNELIDQLIEQRPWLIDPFGHRMSLTNGIRPNDFQHLIDTNQLKGLNFEQVEGTLTEPQAHEAPMIS